MALAQYTPGINRVVIKPFRDKDVKSHTQLVEKRFIDEHFTNSVWGRVMAVPEELFFWEAIKEHSIGCEDYVQVSMPWRTELEVRVGDVVLFDYLAAINEDCMIESPGKKQPYYVMGYDQLIGRLRKGEDESLYPLNGYAFMEVEDDVHIVGGLKKETDRLPEMTRGRVVAQGKPKFRYLLSTDSDPMKSDFVGKIAGYKKFKAFRI